MSSLCYSLHPAASGPLSLIFSKSQSFPLSSCRSTFVYCMERFEVVLSQTSYTLLIPSPLPKRKPPSVLLPPASPGCEMMMSLLSCHFCCCCGYFGVFNMYMYMYMYISLFSCTFHHPTLLSPVLPSPFLLLISLPPSFSPSLPLSFPFQPR